MDKPAHKQESNTAPQKRSFLTRLHIFESILPLIQHSATWLTGIVNLTEEERDDAGIYLGHKDENNFQ